MVERERIRFLNEQGTKKGDYVVYWMQSSQRADCNPALEYSIEKANEKRLPLLVYFGLTEEFPEANERHFKFMIEGLRETKNKLEHRDLNMIIRRENPSKGILGLANEASLIITDRAYMSFLKQWRKSASKRVDCPFIQVEGDVVVPVDTVSNKEEYAARTIRPKIQNKLEYFLKPQKKISPIESSLDLDFEQFEIGDVEISLNKLDLDDVKPVDDFKGGTSSAMNRLEEFIKNKLQHYSDLRNDPTKDVLSNLSPYLHFGQISPTQIALEVKKSDYSSVDDYLEEVIVRRELSMNFVNYNENYNSLECLPDWAYKTLEKHKDDEKEYIYQQKEFEMAKTHDSYWNAAQKEMIKTGKMHSYMRMYWGKKIIEWSENIKDAYNTAIYLNNKYELDGRDPNSYAGVAWCFGKHDRAWKERKIFGKVRYMNANGLKRKFDADTYVDMIERL
ncbi:MAG: deoxyribodipyrimidine photo-lyase [Thermoplasmatota archaeon]